MGTVASLLAEHVSFRCTSVDRIFVAGYVPGLQSEGQVIRFLLQRGYKIPSPAGLAHNHDRLVAETVVSARHAKRARSALERARALLEDALAGTGNGR